MRGAAGLGERLVIRRLWWPVLTAVAVLLVAVGTDVAPGDAGVLRALAVVAAFCGSAFLLVLPGCAALALVDRHRAVGPVLGLGVVFGAGGVAGLLAFWAWYAAPGVGVAFAIALFVAAAAALAWCAPARLLARTGLWWPLLTAGAVGLAYTALLYLEGGAFGGVATHTAGVRVWLTPDNKIPLLFADRLDAAANLKGFLLPSWHSSDRPPLQTGFVLLQYRLFGDRELGYQLLATALQMAWLPATWVALRARGYGDRRSLAVVLAVATTGVVFVNSVFVWPKMLAGGFALVALAVLVSRTADDQRRGSGVLVALLCGLSFLSHGGTAFALIALAPAIWVFARPRCSWRGLGAIVLVLGVLYVPWLGYQRLVDPPGDRLIKWQLAGVIDIDSRSVPAALVDQYTSLSFQELADHKLGNLLTFVARPAMWDVDNADPAWTDGVIGRARIGQLNNIVISAGPLLLGLFALLLVRGRRLLDAARPLALFTALGLAAWALLLYGGLEVTTIIATGPYATVVMFLALCALAVTALPKVWAAVVLAVNAGWFALCWLPGLRFVPAVPEGDGPTDRAMLALLVVAVVAVALVIRGVWSAGTTAPDAPVEGAADRVSAPA